MKRREPERTCLACRKRRPKAEMLRIVRPPEGLVRVDPSGTAEGRGTYVCREDRSCRGAATKRGALSRALRLRLPRDDLARLATEIEKETAGT